MRGLMFAALTQMLFFNCFYPDAERIIWMHAQSQPRFVHVLETLKKCLN